ncbi:hypothetical protein Tco_0495525, partial [Tanacetum coccineum]
MAEKGCALHHWVHDDMFNFLGDKLVSWMSKKQNCTAMSSAEAEYCGVICKLCSSNVDED